MSKKTCLVTRSVVALAAFAVFFWLFLVPPPIESGTGNTYSSYYPIGRNFPDDLGPLVNDSFDVESPSKVQKYPDGAIAHKMKANERIRRDIQRFCHEARLERSVLIVSLPIAFAVTFLSVPKPKPSNGREPSSDNESSGESKSLSDNNSSDDGGPSNGIGSSSDKSKSGKAEGGLLCGESKPEPRPEQP